MMEAGVVDGSNPNWKCKCLPRNQLVIRLKVNLTDRTDTTQVRISVNGTQKYREVLRSHPVNNRSASFILARWCVPHHTIPLEHFMNVGEPSDQLSAELRGHRERLTSAL